MMAELQIFLLAMTPIGGLRISIPTALVIYQLNWGVAYLISVIGSLVPVVLLLLFLEPVSNWFSKKFKVFQQFFSWFSVRIRKKYEIKIRKYGRFALVVFIANPLPFSGGWTASLVTFLFSIPFKVAFPSITLGIMIEGLIVLLVTQFGIAIGKYFGWQALIGLLLVIGFIWIIYNIIKGKKDEPR